MNKFLLLLLICTVGSTISKKGMTFMKYTHDARFGIDNLSCYAPSDFKGVPVCDAYNGDTDCENLLPVLCVKVDDSPRPAYPVTGEGAAMPVWNYFGWGRGHVASTKPVKASQFQTREAVDAFCADAFGSGWKVQSWQDMSKWISGMGGVDGMKYSGSEWSANADKMQSGGWGFYAYGNLRNDTRLWMDGPHDQVSTCWAH
ncbi:unnamed protein product [Adineta steineri]|uniref:Uncharacterized protein n=1 Tax=Adineta steineri TaxID=433720 RepID=A0A814H3L7_9BILA|nr:unnamed protein product [Adineta steineri]CAF1036860.1 unnamed protein product [Adineta steineri]CAF1104913.1 unnamed protein product [Adineta steineri]